MVYCTIKTFYQMKLYWDNEQTFKILMMAILFSISRNKI